MEKRIRIGNDILVTWTLTDANQDPYDLTGKNVKVLLVGDLGAAMIRDITIAANVITFWFRGRDQRATGPYSLALVENCCSDGMVTFDVKNVFYLVDHSWDVSGQDCPCSGVTTETVELDSSLDSVTGPQGPRGLSAYEVAVVEGFEGTVQEWLASLVGPQGPASTVPGPQGPQGGIIWPDLYVDSDLYLHICEPGTQLQDRLSFRNGYLIIN